MCTGMVRPTRLMGVQLGCTPDSFIHSFARASPFVIRFHVLFLDGVYVTSGERLSFRRVPPPTAAALEKLVRGISERVARALERQGVLVRDFENSFLTLDPVVRRKSANIQQL